MPISKNDALRTSSISVVEFVDMAEPQIDEFLKRVSRHRGTVSIMMSAIALDQFHLYYLDIVDEIIIRYEAVGWVVNFVSNQGDGHWLEFS